MKGKLRVFIPLVGIILTGCQNPVSSQSDGNSLSSEPISEEKVTDIDVDGEKDLVFEASPLIHFGVESRAEIQLYYGEKGFNFFVRVDDATNYAENDATWQNDSIEMYIDPLLDGQDIDAFPRRDDMQIRIDTTGRTELYIGVRANDYTWTSSYFKLHKHIIRYDDYYVIEGFIDWYYFGFEEAPDQMGLNFGHVDADAFGFTWGGTAGEDNTNPNTWGTYNQIGEKIVIDYFPSTLFEDAIVFENNTNEFPRVEFVFGETALSVKIHRNLTSKLATNNNTWWDGSQVTFIVDLANDGGTVLDNNDIKLVIRPTGDYAAAIGAGNENGWSLWSPGSWARNGVRNIKVDVDLNGNVLGEVPTSVYYTYVRLSYADFGITKPNAIRFCRFGGNERNPSLWQVIESNPLPL